MTSSLLTLGYLIKKKKHKYINTLVSVRFRQTEPPKSRTEPRALVLGRLGLTVELELPKTSQAHLFSASLSWFGQFQPRCEQPYRGSCIWSQIAKLTFQ